MIYPWPPTNQTSQIPKNIPDIQSEASDDPFWNLVNSFLGVSPIKIHFFSRNEGRGRFKRLALSGMINLHVKLTLVDFWLCLRFAEMYATNINFPIFFQVDLAREEQRMVGTGRVSCFGTQNPYSKTKGGIRRWKISEATKLLNKGTGEYRKLHVLEGWVH